MSMSRLYIVILLILLLCRVHHVKSWVDESQAGIKIAGRNMNKLRFADDATLNGRKWSRTKEPLDEGESVCMCIFSHVSPCNPMGCSLPISFVHGVFQARILEWVPISFYRWSSQPRDWTHVSCFGRQILYHCATWGWKKRVKKLAWSSMLRKTKIMTSSPTTSCQIEGENVETVTFYFSELQNHCGQWLQPWN